MPGAPIHPAQPPKEAALNAAATLSLTRPDDWHLHLRDGEALAAVIGASARQFARAIVMPNLKPPVTTLAQLVRDAIVEGVRVEEVRSGGLPDLSE